MAFNELLHSMEQSAQEKREDILENARASAEGILADAQKRAETIRDELVATAEGKVSIKKNKSLYLLKEDLKAELTREKERIYDQAFSQAESMLGECRNDPRYAESFARLLDRSTENLNGRIVVHVDPVDEALCKRCRENSSLEFEVIPDRKCAGGLDAEIADKGIIVRNTLESRLDNARMLMRKDLFGSLFGE
jgi:Archaeal/vacuolar-type H+-ATPase subunit E